MPLCMERKTRFELATPSLARRCSTTELFPQMATWTGLEPVTSAVTGRHSNQLNHQAVQHNFFVIVSDRYIYYHIRSEKASVFCNLINLYRYNFASSNGNIYFSTNSCKIALSGILNLRSDATNLEMPSTRSASWPSERPISVASLRKLLK